MSGRRKRPLKGVIELPDGRPENEEPISHQELLMREMQHRVANSLQIVASILSLKARTVRSDDARLHLLDAYGRVMSVAAVQRQLLDSKQTSMVQIDDYLRELGQKLAKSLTENAHLVIVVDTANLLESNKAVAMGLIVTELVINALRHAFPKDHGGGRITIRFKTLGSGWKLSVSDDGAGFSGARVKDAPAGHGSKIIDALANELDACIAVRSGSRGTCVSLIHSSHYNEEQKRDSDALMHQARRTKDLVAGGFKQKGAEHV